MTEETGVRLVGAVAWARYTDESGKRTLWETHVKHDGFPVKSLEPIVPKWWGSLVGERAYYQVDLTRFDEQARQGVLRFLEAVNPDMPPERIQEKKGKKKTLRVLASEVEIVGELTSCPKCKARVYKGATFCPYCGESMPLIATPTPPPPQGEETVVSPAATGDIGFGEPKKPERVTAGEPLNLLEEADRFNSVLQTVLAYAEKLHKNMGLTKIEIDKNGRAQAYFTSTEGPRADTLESLKRDSPPKRGRPKKQEPPQEPPQGTEAGAKKV